jgi:hypothetical protein
MMNDNEHSLHRQLVEISCSTLDEGMAKIEHCLGQLTDADVWHRPSEPMNSIGNLLLHLCGNVRQWIVSGVGGSPDTRARPAEFAERGPIAKDELLRRLREAVVAAGDALRRSSADELLRPRHVQHGEVTGVRAIVGSVSHFVGHVQEIVHMTRRLLGERYRFLGISATSD